MSYLLLLKTITQFLMHIYYMTVVQKQIIDYKMKFD